MGCLRDTWDIDSFCFGPQLISGISTVFQLRQREDAWKWLTNFLGTRKRKSRSLRNLFSSHETKKNLERHIYEHESETIGP